MRVRQIIEAQIARLRPEEQRMLEVASVAGAVFTASVCAAAANLDPEHFEALCETLARRQHLVRTAGPRAATGWEYRPALRLCPCAVPRGVLLAAGAETPGHAAPASRRADGGIVRGASA